MNKNSIKFRIPLFISIFALICVMTTGLIFQVIFRQKLEDNIEYKNAIISEMISSELELYLENATDTVVTAANFSTQSSGDLNKVEEEIFRIYDNFQYFDLIFFMNSEAQMVFSKPSNVSVQERVYIDRKYYWDIIFDKKPSTISELLVSSVLNRPHFIIAAPVKNSESEVIGLIGAGIPLYNIDRIVGNINDNFNGKIWIADKSGSIVIHPDYVMEEELIKLDELGIYDLNTEDTMEGLLSKHSKKNVRYKIGTHAYYAAISFVEGSDWMIVVEQDKTSINSEIMDSMNQLFVIQVFVLIFAFIVGLIIANWITKPVEKLVLQVRKLPNAIKNNESIEIITQFKQLDEIYELGMAFSEMGQQLKYNLNDLEQSFIRENRIQQYLNNILTSMHSGIIVADAENFVTIMNEQAKRITSVRLYETAAINLFELLESIELDISENLNQVIEQGVLYTDVEATIKTADQSTLAISYTCSQVRDSRGNYLGVVLLFRDITKIKAIEYELRKDDRIHTIGELTASIIHDIGNPLAGMSNLIELLKDPDIDLETHDEVLGVLGEEVNDLNIMVINFLDFVHSSDAKKIPTDLVQILNRSVEILRGEIDTSKIEITKILPGSPVFVTVEGRSVKQAIINIVKNAIQSIEETGKIMIILDDSKANVELTITDNGKGMNEETLSKIFYPFYTTKDSGTGLGLFIAYNALKENGCTINVDSEFGKGSSFKMIFMKE